MKGKSVPKTSKMLHAVKKDLKDYNDT